MSAFHAGAWLAAALFVELLPVPAAADTTEVVAGVRVVSPSCPIAPLSVSAFVESLRVELAGGPERRGSTVVTLAIEPCDPATSRVRVSFEEPTTGRFVDRVVGLDDVAAAARPRALALVVAELVRGAPPSSSPTAPPSSSVPLAPVAPPPDVPSASLALGVDASMTAFPGRDTVLWGGRLSLCLQGGSWHVAGFLDGASGERRYDLGRVGVQSFGVGLVAGPRWIVGGWALGAGLVGAVGGAHIEGHAGEPGVAARSGSGLTVAARGRASLARSVGRALSIHAVVEGGLMARGLDAQVQGVRATGVSGATVVAGLGLEYAP